MCYLIFVRDVSQAEQLNTAISANGRVVTVLPGDGFAKLDEGRFSIHPAEAEDYIRLLDALPEPPRRLLYAWPWGESSATDSLSERLSLGVEGAFLLTRAVLVKPPSEPIVLLYLHRGADIAGPPAHEPFGAFAKSVSHETRKLICKQVVFADCENAELSTIVPRLLEEFTLGLNDTVIRYKNGVRQRQVFKELTVPRERQAMLPVKQGGRYLITGGAGGLGKILARHLVGLTPLKLVLLGRRPMNAEIAAFVDHLAAKDTECIYYAVDVSKLEALNGFIERLHQEHGELNGIFHTAGLIHDALITKKTLSEFRDVLQPKVFGAYHLDLATQHEPLDFVVYFSSIAALLGNVGQSDYSFANAFLDHYAQYRESLREQGLRSGRTISINWPLWQQGGMQVDEQIVQFSERALGLPPLSSDVGVKLLERCMSIGATQIFAARGERDKVCRIFHLNVYDQTLVEPTESSAQTEKSPVAATDDDEVLHQLQIALAANMVEILELDPKDVEVDTDLNRFGFDSLTFTTFGNRIANELKVEMTPVVFFEYNTIRELSEYMFDEHRDDVIAWYNKTFPASVMASESESLSAPAEPSTINAASISLSKVVAQNELPSDAHVASRPYSVNAPIAMAHEEEPMAIIGMDAVLPQSDDIDSFWRHLLDAEDLITEIPPQRWDWQAVWGDPFQEKNKTSIKWGGFINDVDMFDAAFFGLSRREAELMDPQHRIFLQTVWRCIEDAGYKVSALAAKKKVGLFCGSASIDYHDIMMANDIDADVFAVTGSMFSVLVNRISYLLDFRGPSEPVETACSSSLVAMHRAMQSIRAGECDVAIAGGVHLMLGPSVHIGLDKGGFLSQNGHCATFDKNADGYVRGEGSVALLLKPLSKAEADGDNIHAVIRGSAVNHGGRVNTLTTPNPNAQTEVIVEAWTKAGVDPRTIGCIEAHGTATPLGDPIEVKALRQAFDKLYDHYGQGVNAPLHHCGLGSVKSNIGHLEFVSGAAGVIKMVKALQHETLPETIHFNALNPYIKLEESPFYIIDSTRPWFRAQEADGTLAPLRAGVSSFGFGGVNCHVALEEYRAPVERDSSRKNNKPQVIVLSAKESEVLRLSAKRLLDRLSLEHPPALGDIAYTLAVGREAMQERLLIRVNDIRELCCALEDYLNGQPHENTYRGSKKSGSKNLEFLKSKDDAKRFANSLIDADSLERMVDCWIDGLDLEWQNTPYVKGRRIALPTYPFVKERYWIEEQAVGPHDFTESAQDETADMDIVEDEILAMIGEGLLTESQGKVLQKELLMPE